MVRKKIPACIVDTCYLLFYPSAGYSAWILSHGIVEDDSLFKIYKTNQKDKNHKSTNAWQVMIIVFYITLATWKVVEIISKQALKILNIFMYICAHKI